MFIGLIPMANKEKMKIENKQALYSAYFIGVVGTDIIWWYTGVALPRFHDQWNANWFLRGASSQLPSTTIQACATERNDSAMCSVACALAATCGSII